ncbi:MAG: hypothetical protein ACXIVD_17125 [Salinarimonas sp.]
MVGHVCKAEQAADLVTLECIDDHLGHCMGDTTQVLRFMAILHLTEFVTILETQSGNRLLGVGVYPLRDAPPGLLADIAEDLRINTLGHCIDIKIDFWSIGCDWAGSGGAARSGA